MRSIFIKICQFTSATFLFFIILSASVQAQNEGAILGTWFNTDKSAKIEIFKNGSEFIGKIIWLEQEEKNPQTILDSENSDPVLRKRPIMGLTILQGLKYGDGIWKNGKIYDPESGKTYSCELKLRDKNVLEVKGYLGFSWVGRTVEWTKAF
jgi:uncharacterized protein (DUF2147 family)